MRNSMLAKLMYLSHHHRQPLFLTLLFALTIALSPQAWNLMFDYTTSIQDAGSQVNAGATKTYYVSPDGDNNNAGDDLHPFATPAKATSLALAGDTIILKDGQYTQTATLKFANSGVAGAPITLKAQNQGRAAIIGPSAKGFYGIFIDKNYITIDGIEQKDAGESGIKPSGTNVTIKNCIVHGNGVPYFSGPHLHNGQGLGAVSHNADDFTALNNDIYGNFEHGIYLSGSDRSNILNNKIHDNGYFDLQFNDDGGVDGSLNAKVIGNTIYSSIHPTESGGMNLPTLRSSLVENNLVYEVGKGISLSGTNGASSYIAADNNTFIYNTFISSGYGTVLITDAAATGNKFYNNIIMHTPSSLSGQYPIVIDAGGMAESGNNLIWNTAGPNVAQLPDNSKYTLAAWQSKTHLETNSKNLDPHFTANYHLNADSPAIGLASTAYLLETDLDGIARPNNGTYDAGAYQYNGSSPPSVTADLSSNITLDTTKPKEGDTLTYTVRIANAGPNTATAVVVKDSMPNGLTFVSAAATTGSYDKISGIWSFATLASGASETLTLKATVNVSTNATSIINTASVSQLNTIIDPQGNNSASVSLTVTNVADLGVAIALDNIKPKENESIAYTIKLINFGPSAAVGVVVKDVLPAGISFASANASIGSYDKANGNWTVGTMSGNATAMLLLKATVNAGTLGKSLTNGATVYESSAIYDATGNNTASVSLTVAETPCSTNCGGGSTEPTKSTDSSPPGAGPESSTNQPTASPSTGVTAPSTVTTPPQATSKKSSAAVTAPTTTTVTKLDVKKSYIRVDGDRVRANGKDKFTLVVGVKSDQDQFLLKQIPGVLMSGGQSNVSDWTLVGNEWVLTVTSTEPGTRKAEIKVGKLSIGTASLPFLSDAPPEIKSVKDEPMVHLNPSVQPNPIDLLPDATREAAKEEVIHPTPIYKLWWRKILSFFARFS